jgi:hypothetical protein
MLENEQRIEHTIAEEKSGRERRVPDRLSSFSRRWRPSTNVRLSHLLRAIFFFSSSVHSIEHIEQKSIQERKELNFFIYQFINTDKKEFI